MLDLLSVPELDALLDQFTVPMFVLEREHPDGEFRITCMNRALEDLAGKAREALVGQPIRELAVAAEEMLDFYQRCVVTRQTIRFAFLTSHGHRQIRWDKTLQYARSPEGYDRVIATAVKSAEPEPSLEDRLGFEDVRYFSSVADLQLENLSSALDTAVAHARAVPIDEDRIMRLHAICRTIQSTVGDIKEVVKTAQLRHRTSGMPPPMPSNAAAEEAGADFGMDTVRALVNASASGKDSA